MGRYITGDIERKLWFAVQPSNAADRFGSTGVEPYYLEYYFDEESNLEKVQEELQNIENIIGIENIKKLDEFFDKVNGYNDDIMMKHNILEIWNQNKSDYADYKLGKDIEECLIRKGYCNFQAEL
jgi:hypothetical protein